nr:HEPN domain-containing protein [Nocardia mexicana]
MLADVTSLLEHHPAQNDPRRGRPAGPGYGHLLRSGVALCYTAWEVFVEEALLETVELLLESTEPHSLPGTFRDWIVEGKPSPWAFVGDGWRSEALALVHKRIEGDGKGRFGFNTASVGNVDGLYNQVLGFSPIYAVKWSGRSNAMVRRDVSDLVEIRGEIVHKGTTPGALNLKGVRSWSEFVTRLCEKFDEQLVDFRSEVVPPPKNK